MQQSLFRLRGHVRDEKEEGKNSSFKIPTEKGLVIVGNSFAKEDRTLQLPSLNTLFEKVKTIFCLSASETFPEITLSVRGNNNLTESSSSCIAGAIISLTISFAIIFGGSCSQSAGKLFIALRLTIGVSSFTNDAYIWRIVVLF